MSQQNLTGQASLITGFRVGNKAARGWSQLGDGDGQGSLAPQTQQPQGAAAIDTWSSPSGSLQEAQASSQKSLEDWYKAHYFDYYFKAYKANGLDDVTSSQYAHGCVSELERTGYIKNAIQAQSESGLQLQTGSNPRERQERPKKQKSSPHAGQTRPLQGSGDKSKGLKNWLHRLFSTYRSTGASKDDIEWNQKLVSYSQYISERYKSSNKVIDWDLQNLPRREVIQNFKVREDGEGQPPRGRFSSASEAEPKGEEASRANEEGFSPFPKAKRAREEDLPLGGQKEKETKHPRSRHGGESGQFSANRIIQLEQTPAGHEEYDYVLDASGNRRLSWQQILALGKSTRKIVGLSTALEKQYLRLTSSPDPNLVRPEHVLRKSLEFVYGNYLSYSSAQAPSSAGAAAPKRRRHDWKYLEEQFRSIRQDLTVQGIKNLFTIQVYELNARVALENHDLGQFNQCQTRLKELYSLGLVMFEGSNREEFLCYYIIYVTLQNMKADLIRVLDEAQPYKSYRGISFAIQVCKTLMEGNYCRYFKLCKKAPWKSGFLFDIFRNRQLMVALTTMTKAFRFIEIPTVTSSLGFESDQECHSFLVSQKAVFTCPGSPVSELKLDCKASFAIFSSSPLLVNRKVQALG